MNTFSSPKKNCAYQNTSCLKSLFQCSSDFGCQVDEYIGNSIIMMPIFERNVQGNKSIYHDEEIYRDINNLGGPF